MGAAMALLGRSLAVARAVAIALASLAAAAPYLALRAAGVPRAAALGGIAFAYVTPWALWLGAATVPESMTASLASAAAIGVAAAARAPSRRTALLSALAIAVACLSRYEPWPVAAVLAIALVAHALRKADGPERALFLGVGALCAAAPLAWMAWNAHAHDGPLHFFRRVASYKRAIGEGATDAVAALVLYPRTLVTTRPEVTIPAVLFAAALRDPVVRARWAVPLVAAAAELAFLAYGNVRDGAAAHHPERALLGVTVILAFFVADVLHRRLAARASGGRAGAACIAVLWIASIVRDVPVAPGRTPAEDRSAQIARGEELRRAPPGRLSITPCAFEHFALLAAYGAPERAAIQPRADAGACPLVDTD